MHAMRLSRRPVGLAGLALVLAGLAPVLAGPAAAQDRPGPSMDQAARTPAGLVEALYDMASFGPGPEPDWDMFRDAFLEDAVVVFSPRGATPMRVMDVDAFIRDWMEFFRDAGLEERGFRESIAGMKVDQFGGLAHAWVIFEPRIGEEPPARPLRGLDSIELSFDGLRWWIAAITTDFEAPGQTIPAHLVPEP